MSAEKQSLTFEEQALLDILNWMEATYDDKVWVMDVDFKSGSVALYGDQTLANEFRTKLNDMLTDVYSKVPAWREL